MKIKLSFPAAAQTAALLTEPDDFLRRITDADLSLRLGNGFGAPEDRFIRMARYLDLIRNSAQDWEAPLSETGESDISTGGKVGGVSSMNAREKAENCISRAIEILGPYTVLLPAEIVVCRTDGTEEIGSAYCRAANIVVLNQKALQRDPDQLSRLTVHELFHIISRNNLPLRDALYAAIGFFRSDEIALCEELRDRVITNPDACQMEFSFRTVLARGEGMGTADLYPILLFNADKDSRQERGGNPEPFSLLYYEPTERGIHRLDEIPDFYERIGKNTDFIIHPEEILAENFTIMRCGEEIRTPAVIESIESILNRYIAV